jgi:hypothetical protein
MAENLRNGGGSVYVCCSSGILPTAENCLKHRAGRMNQRIAPTSARCSAVVTRYHLACGELPASMLSDGACGGARFSACAPKIVSRPVNADAHTNSAAARPERAQAGNSGYEVILENLPADYPVSAAELAVIETYFGDILDALFKAASEEAAGIRTQETGGSCHGHQPKAPGTNHGKTSRRGRVRARP